MTRSRSKSTANRAMARLLNKRRIVTIFAVLFTLCLLHYGTKTIKLTKSDKEAKQLHESRLSSHQVEVDKRVEGLPTNTEKEEEQGNESKREPTNTEIEEEQGNESKREPINTEKEEEQEFESKSAPTNTEKEEEQGNESKREPVNTKKEEEQKFESKNVQTNHGKEESQEYESKSLPTKTENEKKQGYERTNLPTNVDEEEAQRYASTRLSTNTNKIITNEEQVQNDEGTRLPTNTDETEKHGDKGVSLPTNTDEEEKQQLESTNLPTNTDEGQKQRYLSASSPRKNETKVYRWKDGKFVQIPHFCSQEHPFQSANVKTPYGTVKMYIHEGEADHPSSFMKKFGLWSQLEVNTMIKHLEQDPNIGLLDLGSHLGTFSIVAAMMGRHVVAVDPLVENVLRLCRTVQEANLTDRVTILFNALSSDYYTVGLKSTPRDIGSTHIKVITNVTMDDDDVYNTTFTRTVKLDDILPFVGFSKAFIKIDVEGHEYQCIREGKQLFQNLDIQGILMEWQKVRLASVGQKIINFFTDRFYKFFDITYEQLGSDYSIWPLNILIMKQEV